MTAKHQAKSCIEGSLSPVVLGIGLSLCVQYTPVSEAADLQAYTFSDAVLFQDILAQKVARLRCLAESGETGAQYELGLLYRDGLGVKQSVAEAFYWLEKAAFNGHAEASYDLAMLYAEYDESDKALHWIDVAAKHGNAKAEHAYDYMLSHDFGYGC
jgi:TPR repeat protein